MFLFKKQMLSLMSIKKYLQIYKQIHSVSKKSKKFFFWRFFSNANFSMIFQPNFRSKYIILFRKDWILRIWKNICKILYLKMWKLHSISMHFYAIPLFSSSRFSGLLFLYGKFQKIVILKTNIIRFKWIIFFVKFLTKL